MISGAWIYDKKKVEKTAYIITEAKLDNKKKSSEKRKANPQATIKHKMHSTDKKWIETHMAVTVFLIFLPLDLLFFLMSTIAQMKIWPAQFANKLPANNIPRIFPGESKNLPL